ncbi:hypothetical protein [Nannocystis pusilla]|uniref:hypothetical protein n=1 Tax=Nannocystis pusilla TaxID=889268 RepID=UPI003DA223CA
MSAWAYALAALARLPASRSSSAKSSRSSSSTTSAAPPLYWLTMSNTASSRRSLGVLASRRRAIRRWATARSASPSSAYEASRTRSWRNV